MGRRGKTSFLFVVHECVGEHGEQKNNYLGFKIALGDFHAHYYYLCVMLVIFWVQVRRNVKYKENKKTNNIHKAINVVGGLENVMVLGFCDVVIL